MKFNTAGKLITALGDAGVIICYCITPSPTSTRSSPLPSPAASATTPDAASRCGTSRCPTSPCPWSCPTTTTSRCSCPSTGVWPANLLIFLWVSENHIHGFRYSGTHTVRYHEHSRRICRRDSLEMCNFYTIEMYGNSKRKLRNFVSGVSRMN